MNYLVDIIDTIYKNIWDKIKYLPLPFKKGFIKRILNYHEGFINSSYFTVEKILQNLKLFILYEII